jgi:hypothetical protein
MIQEIVLAREPADVFVHVPSRLNLPYLEGVLSRARGRDVRIARCETTNLCGGKWRVSNSGATVLRLGLTLSDGERLDLVAKFLSPDPLNLFKIDVRFSARLAEVAWAAWWAKHNVPWVPVTYDTRSDVPAREFWILHEYFPQVGWRGMAQKELRSDSPGADNLRCLLRQAAALHAHSRMRIDELRALFGAGPEASAGARPSAVLRRRLMRAVEDAAFLSTIGVTDEERESVQVLCEALGDLPPWVEEWDEVCVTSDWAPDNFGIRAGRPDELVTFDWGTARLAPMEDDINVIQLRLKGVEAEERRWLLSYYLEAYEAAGGRRIEIDEFQARLPWAWLLTHIRMIAEHIEALRWIPYQTLSRDKVHLFTGVCGKLLAQCRR